MAGELVIRNVELVDLASGERLPRDIVVSGGTIEAVEPAGTVARDLPVVDGRGSFAIPGLVNAHTHSHNALSRGLGDRWSLELLLTHGPALNARRTPDDHYWAAMLNGLEMLKSGTTAAYDLVIHLPLPTPETIDAVCRAYRDLGLRAIVAPAFADRPFVEIVPGLLNSLPDELRAESERALPAPADTLLASLRSILEAGTGSDRVRHGIAPTIPAQCSDELLRGAAQLAREFAVGLHTHLAESRVQAVDGLQRYGVTLTRHLEALGLLGPEFVAAHGVWLSPDDIALLAERGAVVAHNPASNLKLGNGVAPVRQMRRAGVEVALGTDGSASSDNQNLFEAMRFAASASRIESPDPGEWLDAREVLAMATAGGACACGLARPAGRLEPGQPADIVLLRRESVALQPVNDLPTQLVFAESGAAVDTVIIAGEVVMEGGHSTRVDEQRVYAEAQAAIDRVRAANAAEWEMARRMTPYVVAACSQLSAVPYPIERRILARS